MPDDIENDPEFRKWARRIEAELVPMIDGSSCTVSLVPRGPSDVKFAVELGLSIMMDKPIILAIMPGMKIPAKLAKVADDIIEVDVMGDPQKAQKSVTDAILRMQGLKP